MALSLCTRIYNQVFLVCYSLMALKLDMEAYKEMLVVETPPLLRTEPAVVEYDGDIIRISMLQSLRFDTLIV